MVDLSIIITAYNYEKYIKECIESCINQSEIYNLEIIVIDDGSTDNTFEISKKLNEESDKITIFSIKNSGIERASNFGFEHAKGEFLLRVDADDKLHTDFIEKALPIIKNSDLDFVYTNYDVIDKDGYLIEQIDLPDFDWNEILKRGDFLATGTIFRASTINKIGKYNTKYKNCGLENYELMIKLYKVGCKGKLVKNHLFDYRRHSLNISELKKNKIIEYGQHLFKDCDLGDYRTNEFHPYKLKV